VNFGVQEATMCWYCDHPDRSPHEYLDQMRELIDRCGWAVQGVERDRSRPPWAYTVGLTAAGWPELVVTGLPLARATDLLNSVAAHAMHAATPRLGEQVRLRGGSLIEIVEVAEPAAHLLIAAELYGTGIRALQVVHADDREHWPWEVGYRGVRGGQPVLGVRAAPVGGAS
jgi:transposase